MQIQCKLHREGGTVVEIGGINYEFLPNHAGDHVADVQDEAHIARFLSIPEAYKLYMTGSAAPAEKKPLSKQIESANDGADDIDALREAYKQKFGKKPHHTWGVEKLKELLSKDGE